LDYPEDVLAAAQWRKSIGEQRSEETSARAALKWLDPFEEQERDGVGQAGSIGGAVSEMRSATPGEHSGPGGPPFGEQFGKGSVAVRASR
jgi:hypothetical protein